MNMKLYTVQVEVNGQTGTINVVAFTLDEMYQFLKRDSDVVVVDVTSVPITHIAPKALAAISEMNKSQTVEENSPADTVDGETSDT